MKSVAEIMKEVIAAKHRELRSLLEELPEDQLKLFYRFYPKNYPKKGDPKGPTNDQLSRAVTQVEHAIIKNRKEAESYGES